MNDWQDQLKSTIEDLRTVCDLAKVRLPSQIPTIEFLRSPHKPPTRLHVGKRAIYAFYWNNSWLKIGIAGPKSNARYTSQHYRAGSAPSTLAASLLNDVDFCVIQPTAASDMAKWIKESTNRANILFDEAIGSDVLLLAEAFLHVRLKPKYERKIIAGCVT
jgi:hypothetical protein